MPGMEKKNLQKVNGEFKIGTRPNEKCITVSVEHKSKSSFAERNVSICTTGAKYLDCSCTKQIQDLLEGIGVRCGDSRDG